MIDKNNNGIDDALENARFNAELAHSKRTWSTRKKMAVTSFIGLFVFIIFYISIGFFVTAERADVMSEFNIIIITIITALVSIVLAFIGADYLQTKNNGS